MQNKFLKIAIGVLCIYFIILCLRPNVMSQIGKQKVYGTNSVSEIDRNDTWEWMSELRIMGAFDVNYKEEYLREDVSFIHLCFFDKRNDVNIGIMVNLSESDKVRMKLDMYYDYEEKKLIYKPVYILQGESGYSDIYEDEKSIDEYLSKYGLTRQDVKEYQEYAIYDVIVKTWTKARITQWYWLESLKLKLCKVEDNTFQFEEESVQSEAEDIETIETDTVIKTAEMYMEEARAYIEEEDYLAAVEVLMEGVEKTGDETLAEKENDLREHIIIIKEKKYKDGKLSEEIEYNKDGNQIKIINYNKRPDRIAGWSEYEYDENGNIVAKHIYSGDETEVYEYGYDETGGVKTIYYNSDGSIMFWEEREYEHDKSGRLVKSRLVREGHTTECSFDAFENMVEIKTNGEVSDSYEYEYAYAD